MFVIYSVPASAFFFVVSSLILHMKGRKLLPEQGSARTGLYQFVRYGTLHSLFSLIVFLAAGGYLYITSLQSVYGYWGNYVLHALIVTCGPLIAWLLSSVILIRLMLRRGARVTNLLYASLAYVFLLLSCIPLMMLVMAFTGTSI